MDPLSLYSSMVWSTIGLAYFIYGKKRGRPAPLVGGVFLMALAWFARTPISLSIAGVAVVAGIYFVSKRI